MSAGEIAVLAGLLGLITGVIAQSKGLSFVTWWIFGALMFILALPLVLMTPKTTARAEQDRIMAHGAPAAGFRYNCPPNWPLPRPGWVPPPGWQPDPAWGPAPEGWQFWTPVIPAAPASTSLSTGAIVVLVVAVLLVAGVYGVYQQGGSFLASTDSATTADAVPPPVDVPPAAAPPVDTAPELSPADSAKQNDKGWVLETYRGSSEDRQTVTARIKNAHAVAETALFTMTLLDGQTPVATFHGAANGVLPGQTVTVQLSSADTLPASVKADSFQFQTDTTVDTP